MHEHLSLWATATSRSKSVTRLRSDSLRYLSSLHSAFSCETEIQKPLWWYTWCKICAVLFSLQHHLGTNQVQRFFVELSAPHGACLLTLVGAPPGDWD
eukprot:4656865-Amphidinium_carterae.1